jgi:hypothetical protein
VADHDEDDVVQLLRLHWSYLYPTAAERDRVVPLLRAACEAAGATGSLLFRFDYRGGPPDVVFPFAATHSGKGMTDYVPRLALAASSPGGPYNEALVGTVVYAAKAVPASVEEVFGGWPTASMTSRLFTSPRRSASSGSWTRS